jgi:hypothetical protein
MLNEARHSQLSDRSRRREIVRTRLLRSPTNGAP